MKIKKIVISCQNKNILKKVAGQQPVAVFAKKSIANFGIREGQVMSFFVTLRKKRLKAFLDRFCRVILPGQSRFQGFQTNNESGSNFTVNLEDSIPFLELKQDDIDNLGPIGLSLSFYLDNVLHKSNSKEKKTFNNFLKKFPVKPENIKK